MKEKPILFSPPMVSAILRGDKTMTRRVIIPQPDDDGITGVTVEGFQTALYQADEYWINTDDGESIQVKPRYEKGDILWVRETWREMACHKSGCKTGCALGANCPGYVYKSSYLSPGGAYDTGGKEIKWKPSIFMPRSAAYIFLKVKTVREERLQDISEREAKAEGVRPCIWFQPYGKPEGESICFNNDVGPFPCISYRAAFFNLWESLNAKRGYTVESNPWVWVMNL